MTLLGAAVARLGAGSILMTVLERPDGAIALTPCPTMISALLMLLLLP